MRILTKTVKSEKKGMVNAVSAKQRILVVAAILTVILVAGGLILYSVTNAQDYDGIFVSGIRQVWY